MLRLVERVSDRHDDREVVRDRGGEGLLGVVVLRRGARVDGARCPRLDVLAHARTSAGGVGAREVVLDEARVAGVHVGLALVGLARSWEVLAADVGITRVCMAGLVEAIRDVVVRPLVIKTSVLGPLDGDSVGSSRQHVEAVAVGTFDGTLGIGAAGIEVGVSRLAARLACEFPVDADQEVLSLVVRVRDGQHYRVVIGCGEADFGFGAVVLRRCRSGSAI